MFSSTPPAIIWSNLSLVHTLMRLLSLTYSDSNRGSSRSRVRRKQWIWRGAVISYRRYRRGGLTEYCWEVKPLLTRNWSARHPEAFFKGVRASVFLRRGDPVHV